MQATLRHRERTSMAVACDEHPATTTNVHPAYTARRSSRCGLLPAGRRHYAHLRAAQQQQWPEQQQARNCTGARSGGAHAAKASCRHASAVHRQPGRCQNSSMAVQVCEICGAVHPRALRSVKLARLCQAMQQHRRCAGARPRTKSRARQRLVAALRALPALEHGCAATCAP